jgi:hypothetical protein
MHPHDSRLDLRRTHKHSHQQAVAPQSISVSVSACRAFGASQSGLRRELDHLGARRSPLSAELPCARYSVIVRDVEDCAMHLPAALWPAALHGATLGDAGSHHRQCRRTGDDLPLQPESLGQQRQRHDTHALGPTRGKTLGAVTIGQSSKFVDLIGRTTQFECAENLD